ncbi:glycosyltransferase family 2 protein [Streptomyces sp. ME19-01-6]|uniref:glycosyltransferase family 2 protein n=1 Tax=Streptomyces sp. ME19-01-6 TaxID=3028686 RepID=UPI0029B547C3|nr:glycosyltransferase family 2 protein [Streptomyces sp. ME19-01-6]MDX3228655.1 glycosyltransferase family 2 protein [Streptomyces sp. ME19-01-6]
MPPRLSVIIPFYNSGPYLAECLESVAAQDLSDLEVILVDDGSTDESPVIAARFARDSRFRILRRPVNKGPGSARNAGIAHSDPCGDYLAFADSDDLLPENAYATLVASLDDSGSDFAAGNVLRFNSSGFFPCDKYAAFRERRARTHISDIPELAMDRTMWNKVYRRTFWDRYGLSFPEGMFYEDSPVSVPLHFMAKAVDITSDTVYYWRIREAGAPPSITQQRTVRAMLDRFRSIDLIRAFLKDRQMKSAASCLALYDRNILAEELPLFFDELIEASERHRHAFVKRAAILLGRIDPALVEEVPPSLREKYSAITDGRVHDLISSLEGQRDG